MTIRPLQRLERKVSSAAELCQQAQSILADLVLANHEQRPGGVNGACRLLCDKLIELETVVGVHTPASLFD